MTRAEQEAKEIHYLALIEANKIAREQWDKGYKQAEKDLALTAEDMAKIDAIILDVNNEFAVDYSKEISRQKFYDEVLKRFKEQKDETNS